MFPYTKGLLFQDAAYKKHGRQSFTDVFEHAPTSTAQILHPEVYEKGTKPVDVELAGIRQPKKYHALAEGSVGEFDHHILLSQFVDERTADEVAPLWRGGTFRLYETHHETKAGRQPLLNYASMWDSEETAARFLKLYRKILEHKWTKLAVAIESDSEIAGTGDYGPFRVWRKGAVVYSLEGGLH